jgi:hypothetical protein
MWSNHLALKVLDILTMSINSIRRSMGLSKHQEYGMNALRTFLLKMILELVRPTLFSSLEKWIKICLYAKSMFMIGVLTFFLRFQIRQTKEGIFISQTKYTDDILKKFGMDKAKPIKTLMGTNGHLDIDLGGTSLDQKVYHSMIGSLLYLCLSTLDIMLNVCMCIRL